jgi:hypothetical protein
VLVSPRAFLLHQEIFLPLTRSVDTVLVVEYGYLDHSPSITLVGQAPRDPALRDEYTAATRMYNITSTPQPWLDGRTKPVFCGSVVGGSSAVNGDVSWRLTTRVAASLISILQACSSIEVPLRTTMPWCGQPKLRTAL